MQYCAERHSLRCPKCEQGMQEITHEGVTIDRCSHCQGLWFDADEAQQLIGKSGSERLDSGDPDEGWKWDRRVDINCPRCGAAMQRCDDPQQLHIWYEVCPDHGMFMDAGEFTDFKQETLVDWFQDLIKGKRKRVAPE